MIRYRQILTVLLLTCLVTLAACAANPESAEQVSTSDESTDQAEDGADASSSGEKTVIIGFTASQTGKLNVESVRQMNGLKLWMDQLNEAGGITLSDGTVLKFEARSYDDESNKDRVQELYTKLINEDNANFLISPYSSGLSDAAAVIAEQYGRVLITTGAASDSTYKKGYTLVYQSYTPASRYLAGAVDFLKKLDPSVKKIAIVHENDKFSTDVTTALDGYAKENGYEVVLFEGYDSGTTDFAPFINKIAAASPDAVMGGGHFADTSTFARQLHEKGVKTNFVALLVAPPEPQFAELGDAAVGVIGPSQWEPLAEYTPDGAESLGAEWAGPSADEFVSSYESAYNEEPSYHSAGGYAAGLILQKAIEDADSVETEKVKEALDGMNLLSFFGQTKFETSAESHGLQIGHEMVYVQWQKSDDGELVKEVVWPAESQSAEALYPIN